MLLTELEGLVKQVKSIRAWPVDEQVVVGVEVDGETPGRLPARFEVHPASLTVRVPAQSL